jgi:hypothetical protein
MSLSRNQVEIEEKKLQIVIDAQKRRKNLEQKISMNLPNLSIYREFFIPIKQLFDTNPEIRNQLKSLKVIDIILQLTIFSVSLTKQNYPMILLIVFEIMNDTPLVKIQDAESYYSSWINRRLPIITKTTLNPMIQSNSNLIH